MSLIHERNFTVQQVAALLQVTDDTVRRWIQDGRLRAFRLGNRWRILGTDLDGLVQGEDEPARRMTAAERREYEQLLRNLKLD